MRDVSAERFEISRAVVTVTSNTLLCHFHKQISQPLRSFKDHEDLYVLFGSEVIEDLK